MKTTHYFTFGQSHMANAEYKNGGRLADYWVAVEAEDGHRSHFVDRFTSQFCPRPDQWAMEYSDDNFAPDFFPGGELARITV